MTDAGEVPASTREGRQRLIGEALAALDLTDEDLAWLDLGPATVAELGTDDPSG